MENSFRKFPYALQPFYPHLTENEAAIWSRFIDKYPDFFEWCAYDVCVGKTRTNNEDLRPEIQRNKEYLGRYKIDVLGFKNGAYWIIEIKKSATSTAMGEIWLYEHCFRECFGNDIITETMVVTDEERPNVRDALEKDGVSFYVV